MYVYELEWKKLIEEEHLSHNTTKRIMELVEKKTNYPLRKNYEELCNELKHTTYLSSFIMVYVVCGHCGRSELTNDIICPHCKHPLIKGCKYCGITERNIMKKPTDCSCNHIDRVDS